MMNMRIQLGKERPELFKFSRVDDAFVTGGNGFAAYHPREAPGGFLSVGRRFRDILRVSAGRLESSGAQQQIYDKNDQRAGDNQ
jgi:hypothetical protein